jgi:hypothetical protein
MRWPDASEDISPFARLVSLTVLFAPAATLGALAYHLHSVPVAVGAGVLALFGLALARVVPSWRPPVSATVIVLYLIALAWAWLPTRGASDWAPHLAQGGLLVAAVGLIVVHDLNRTGAEPLRRANRLCRRLSARTRWPERLDDCRAMADVGRLRAALQDDPTPALALLDDPRATVQVAALGALEYRTAWRPGEAELVLRTARHSGEPGVRAAACYALAGVETADLVAGLAGFLSDTAPEVRRAAADALLWGGDRRWPLARDAVRFALSEPHYADDGALFAESGRLPAAAVCDLTVWAGEDEPLAGRSVATLVRQYDRQLHEADRPELGSELSRLMLDPVTPPALRVELAALLRDHQTLTPDLLDRLTNPEQPGPIRLLAAEAMLRANPHDPDGLDVLRGLARQPNRELAVAVAGVLQNIFGYDLGLPPGDTPPPQSKSAAEAARRVLAWANGAPPKSLRPSTPGPLPGLSGVRPGLSGGQNATVYLEAGRRSARGSSAPPF